MDIDKGLLVNIVLLIHMALTGIMLFHLFKLKNATGGQLILTFIALMIPIIGPSALIVFYTNQVKKKQKDESLKKSNFSPQRQSMRKKK